MAEPGKLKRQWTLSREEAAGWLSILAEALAAGAMIEVDVAGEQVSLHPADEIRTEIKLKSRPDKQEIEIELAWSPTPGSQAAAEAGAPAESEAVAGQEPQSDVGV